MYKERVFQAERERSRYALWTLNNYAEGNNKYGDSGVKHWPSFWQLLQKNL